MDKDFEKAVEADLEELRNGLWQISLGVQGEDETEFSKYAVGKAKSLLALTQKLMADFAKEYLSPTQQPEQKPLDEVVVIGSKEAYLQQYPSQAARPPLDAEGIETLKHVRIMLLDAFGVFGGGHKLNEVFDFINKKVEQTQREQ